MAEWKPIETAPKDGRWILVEGEMRGGDTSSYMVGRWNPSGAYDWECIETDPLELDSPAPVDLVTDWYPEGRISNWMPLPSKGE